MSALDQALRQIPFGYEANRVRSDVQHALNSPLLDAVPSVRERERKKALSVVGTLVIRYRGTPYNLPIELVINAGYPRRPPKAFVRPTPDMMIRDRHAHVDGSGVVYLPYLSSWQPRCDLVRLVQEMSTTFGNDPPLFARPQNQPPVQQIPTTPISPSVQIKQHATLRVRRAATLRLAQLKAAIDVELKAQQKLHALTDSAAETERRAAASRRAADAAVLELGAAQDSLRRWYAATYEDPPVPSLNGDADAAALLAALARANAAEDALYELDAALADGRVGFDDFIRDVRRLARKQFFDKMRAAKIVAKRSPDRGVYRQSF